MDDGRIIELYWARSERAISETAAKYGPYCHYIAYGILRSEEDAEECVSDTYMRAWNAMPPKRPGRLSAFLGRITRNLSLNRFEERSAQKRGGGQAPLALDELRDCLPAGGRVEQDVENMALAETLDRFLRSLPPDTRKMFMRRYWYLSPISEIADDFAFSESKVKMALLRARNQLRQLLEKEGVAL